jgi:DNA-binding NtrC family response regulator
VVNLSSIAGKIGSPRAGFYQASKWSVEALSEALYHEVSGFGIRVVVIEPGYYEALEAYEWPGNVRELRNVLERAIILENEETLLLEHLPQEVAGRSAPAAAGPVGINLPAEGIDIEDVERELIRQALDQTNGNQSKAAKMLHLGIDAFRYRMKKFGFL